MFDDPKKELKRLEEQLLKAEMTDDDFEKFYSEIYKEFGPASSNEDLSKDVPVHKNSNPSGRTQTSRPRNDYADAKRALAPKKKAKGIRGLVITACLESAGIIAIVLWWVLRIL